MIGEPSGDRVGVGPLSYPQGTRSRGQKKARAEGPEPVSPTTKGPSHGPDTLWTLLPAIDKAALRRQKRQGPLAALAHGGRTTTGLRAGHRSASKKRPVGGR